MKLNIISTPLDIVNTEGGKVMHAMKNIDNKFLLGEAYFSEINYLSVRAWKMHKIMTMNLIVPVGNIKFVFYNEKGDEKEEVIVGEKNYVRLTVPPKTWFGFMGLSKLKNLLLNLSDITHDKNEMKKKDITEFDYKWSNL